MQTNLENHFVRQGEPRVFWTEGISDEQLASVNSFCYLTGVRGALNGSETVTTFEVIPGTPNLFHIRVDADTPNQTMSGSAGCVAYSPTKVPDPHISVFTWSQGSPPVQMITGAQGVCFLTGIRGKFRGSGEFVEIDHDPANPLSNNPQMLLGHSDQQGVLANAMCVRYKAP